MFAKQQAVSVLNKAREEYNAQLQKEKEMGLDEAAQTEPMRRSEMDTHDMEGTETVHATVPKRSVDPKSIPKHFIPGAACETSVHDVLFPQQFQDSITPPHQRVHRRPHTRCKTWPLLRFSDQVLMVVLFYCPKLQPRAD